ncbi:MAG: glycosyltransferase family 2 protein [Candidatus Binatia bacterium]
MSESPSLPTASIVVSTLDRAAHLRNLLASFDQLDYPSFEVVVVNGPSTDGTEALLATYDGRIKVVRCPVANLSRSRNTGIAAAAGELVAFIDDDALPATIDWLHGLALHLAAAPVLGGVGGPSLRGDGDDYEFCGRLVSDYGEIVSLEDAASRGIRADGVRWAQAAQGNNCVFRREALLAIGGFDENFPYFLDETDVCFRLARCGRPVDFARRWAVRHYNAASIYRRTWHDRRWDVMARSDAYYALKNGGDPFPGRLVRTLALVRTKFPYRQINDFYTAGEYGAPTRLRYLARWARGVTSGVRWGLTKRRRAPLDQTSHPCPFLPFHP